MYGEVVNKEFINSGWYWLFKKVAVIICNQPTNTSKAQLYQSRVAADRTSLSTLKAG